MNARWLWPSLLALPAVAQDLQKAHEASTAMHAAWLREVLDLDVKGAVQDYQRIAADARPSNLERWLAMARLGELHRIGIDTGPRIPITEAPQVVRSALQATDNPLPVEELLQRLQAEPAEVMRRVGTDPGKMPPLRAAVPLVQEWVRSQIGPSVDDYLGKRMQAMSRNQPDQRSEQSLANDVLNLELQGRSELANNRRSLFFANWQPMTASGDPAAALTQVRTRIELWSKEADISPLHQRRLNDLRQAIDRAGADPAAIVAMIARVPVYAERLLGPEPVVEPK